MRAKPGKAVSRYLGAFVFLLLLVKDFFPSAALAFTSANSCFKDAACRILLQEAFRSSVKAPLDTGSGNAERIRVTDSSGATKASVDSVGNTTMVVGPSPAYATFHYWDRATNGLAQNKAREKYCTANPGDSNCVVPQNSTHIQYTMYGTFDPSTSPTVRGYDFQVLREYKPYVHWGIFKITGCNGSTYYVEFSRLSIISSGGDCVVPQNLTHIQYTMYGIFNPSTSPVIGGYDFQVLQEYKAYVHWGIFKIIGCDGNTKYVEFSRLAVVSSGAGCTTNNARDWRNWPQAKRDAAVDSLDNSDWQSLAKSMPVGKVNLRPGDKITAKTIVIPGQEIDNPNTLQDDRQLKTVPGEKAIPVYPDNDRDEDPDSSDHNDDNDGVIDQYDPQPRNPAVPTKSVEPPPPDQPNPPDSEAGGATGNGAFALEETLPYAPPGTVTGQLQPDSCVAATCRAVIYDSTGSDIFEYELRNAAKVDGGAPVSNVVDALAQNGVNSRYDPTLSPEALKAKTENGPVIVSIKNSLTEPNEHALIVDGFEGDYALIRDPLPLGVGSAYKVKTEIFMRDWTGKAVIIEP